MLKSMFDEKIVIDKKGRQIAVLIDLHRYKKILKLLKEAEVIKIIKEGEKEYKNGNLKAINSLKDLA